VHLSIPFYTILYAVLGTHHFVLKSMPFYVRGMLFYVHGKSQQSQFMSFFVICNIGMLFYCNLCRFMYIIATGVSRMYIWVSLCHFIYMSMRFYVHLIFKCFWFRHFVVHNSVCRWYKTAYLFLECFTLYYTVLCTK
jgi:hypothetical protein